MNKPLTFSPIERSFVHAWSKVIGCDDDELYYLESQYHIGPYRVDFAHIRTFTIIELDGRDYHSTFEDTQHDLERQAYLEENGWTVIRFSGSYIYYHPALCAQVVFNHVTSQLEHTNI